MLSMLMIIFGLIGKEDAEAAGVKTGKLTSKDKWKEFMKDGRK